MFWGRMPKTKKRVNRDEQILRLMKQAIKLLKDIKATLDRSSL